MHSHIYVGLVSTTQTSVWYIGPFSQVQAYVYGVQITKLMSTPLVVRLSASLQLKTSNTCVVLKTVKHACV